MNNINAQRVHGTMFASEFFGGIKAVTVFFIIWREHKIDCFRTLYGVDDVELTEFYFLTVKVKNYYKKWACFYIFP